MKIVETILEQLIGRKLTSKTFLARFSKQRYFRKADIKQISDQITKHIWRQYVRTTFFFLNA